MPVVDPVARSQDVTGSAIPVDGSRQSDQVRGHRVIERGAEEAFVGAAVESHAGPGEDRLSHSHRIEIERRHGRADAGGRIAEIESVAAAAVIDGIGAGRREHIAIVAVRTIQAVVAQSVSEHVVPLATQQQVVAGTARDRIVAVVANQCFIVGRASQSVVTVTTDNRLEADDAAGASRGSRSGRRQHHRHRTANRRAVGRIAQRVCAPTGVDDTTEAVRPIPEHEAIGLSPSREILDVREVQERSDIAGVRPGDIPSVGEVRAGQFVVADTAVDVASHRVHVHLHEVVERRTDEVLERPHKLYGVNSEDDLRRRDVEVERRPVGADPRRCAAEVQHVGARGFGEYIRRTGGEDVSVVTQSSIHIVAAQAIDQRVVVIAAEQRIVAGPGVERVKPVVAIERVAANARDQRVVARTAGQRVIAIAGRQRVSVVAAVERVVASAGDQRVIAIAADQRIGSIAGCQRVSTGTAIERVVAGSRDQRVVAKSAEQRIVAIARVHQVVVVAAIERVVASARQQRVVARATQERVGSIARRQRVSTGTAVERVVARTGNQRVVVVAAAERVIAVGSHQRIVAVAAEHRVVR